MTIFWVLATARGASSAPGGGTAARGTGSVTLGGRAHAYRSDAAFLPVAPTGLDAGGGEPEAAILATVLAIFSWFAFVWGLKLQFPVWPTFIAG